MDNGISLEKITGTWKLVKADEDFDIADGVDLLIDDGKIEYRIRNGLRTQIINLTFHLEGNLLVSDQPSAPKEETTKISFNQKRLLLEYQGSKAWFEKVT